MIPDTVIAEVVWGERSRWPQRWRRDVNTLVNKLPTAFVEHAEWRPVWADSKRKNTCPDRCPLHGADARHRHLLVFASSELMGLLEHYCIDHLPILGRLARQYDFAKPQDKDNAKKIDARWKEGLLAYLHSPALVYGPAAWSGLSAIELNAWQAVFAELTRGPKSERPDRARVIREPECSLLPGMPHVVFAGNFKTTKRTGGRGYRLIGQTNKGWLKKAGVKLAKTEQPLAIDNREAVRRFIRALADLENKFGLKAVGRLGNTWLDSTALLGLANSRSRAEWTALMDVLLRVFAPEDYLERIQAYFRKQGGFAALKDRLPLAVRINVSGMKKQEIAKAVGISPSALSEFLSGRRDWPPRVREALDLVLEQVQCPKNSAKVDRPE